MSPDKPGGAPGKGTPRNVSPGTALDASTIARGPVTGCPCGCATWLPWIDDPGCARHRPLPPARDWPAIDVAALGLAPHPRETCGNCQAAGQ